MRQADLRVVWGTRGKLRVDFFLFILVTAILFIRPTDFVPGLEAVPLYYLAILPCLIVSGPSSSPS